MRWVRRHRAICGKGTHSHFVLCYDEWEGDGENGCSNNAAAIPKRSGVRCCLAPALIGIAGTFDPDMLMVKIGVVAKGRASPAAAVGAMADIHYRGSGSVVTIGDPHRRLAARAIRQISMR
jgi:hypothetical protein